MYKKISIAIFFLLYACTIIAQKDYTIHFNENDFSFSKNDFGEIRIETDGNYYYLPDTLLPALPYTNVRILIPPYTKINDLKFTYKTKTVLENVTLEHNPQIFTTNDYNIDKYQYSTVKYKEPLYPENILNYEGVYNLGGFYFASFSISPFIYNSTNKDVQIITSCNISIKTEEEKSATKFNVYKQMHLGTISNMVINWDEFASMYNGNMKVPLPKNSIDSLDYVIITCDSLVNSFKPLIDWKIKKGLKAEILTLSKIINEAPPIYGNDLTLKIKYALYNLYTYRNLKWILIGGDFNIIPTKGCYGNVSTSTKTYTDYTIPSDLFYACFDDYLSSKFDWDYNNNGIIAEKEDSINIFPDVYISRLPFQTNEQIESYVSRLLKYEQNPNANVINTMLLMGCRLGLNNLPLTIGKSDAHQISEKLYNYSIDTDSSTWNGNTTTLYDTGTSLPLGASYDITVDNFQSQLNNNYHFINILTHGTYYSLALEDDIQYTIDSIKTVTNASNSIFLSNSCYANAYDYSECIGEALIRNKNGCISMWGSSREGFIVNASYLLGSVGYSSYFFHELFHTANNNIGKVASLVKNKMYNNTSVSRWLHFSMNLLGDPEMPIYTKTPSTFDNISISNSSTNVLVSTGGIDSCTIALTSKDSGQSYFEVVHNVGCATFSNVTLPYNVVISKHNFVPYQYSCDNVYIQNLVIESDTIIQADNIYVGRNVNPNETQGDVIVNSNTNVIFDANNNSFIKNGFVIESGSTLSVQ